MRRHRADFLILALVMALLVVGLIVLYAVGPMRVSYLNAINTKGVIMDEQHFFSRQLINIGIALTGMAVAYFWPYEKVKKWTKWIMLIGLVLCLVLMILGWTGSGLAKCELGACRWYNFGRFSIQPAEILKLGVMMYVPQLIKKNQKNGRLTLGSDFLVPFLSVVGLTVFFVAVVQKDLGSTVPIMMMIAAMLWMGRMRALVFWIMMAVFMLGGVGLMFSEQHRIDRFKTFSNAEGANSYHIENALIAIGTGGLMGVGTGNSVQATGYLPESINDSIFAVLGETYGFIGLGLVVLLFVLLLLRLIKIAERSEDMENSLVVVGVFTWILAHAAINMMAMAGIIPLTGITLPFLSYGGTSMLFLMIGIGVVLQLSRQTTRAGASLRETGGRA